MERLMAENQRKNKSSQMGRAKPIFFNLTNSKAKLIKTFNEFSLELKLSQKYVLF
jgi:hypothetical protein